MERRRGAGGGARRAGLLGEVEERAEPRGVRGAGGQQQAAEHGVECCRVGGRDRLLRSSCRLEDVRYIAGRVSAAAFSARVKVRSHAPLAAAKVTPLGDQARIDFEEPQRALAPGQAAVFYDGDRVIGGGPIAAGEV